MIKAFYALDRVGVKVCGILTAAQADGIISAGVDAVGLNFWPKSKRYIAPQDAQWAKDLAGVVLRVAVLVNPEDELIAQVASLVDVIQLHGDETSQRCEHIAQMGLPVIKALQVKDEAVLASIRDYAAAEAVLLDSYNPGQYGGEGRSFPWELAVRAVRGYPDRPIILAGGLTPENVAEAVGGVMPAAVDVASGVESSPGVKDMEKVRDFIQQVRSAHSRLS
jgi:phosphoribosylanthranilate isomerase